LVGNPGNTSQLHPALFCYDFKDMSTSSSPTPGAGSSTAAAPAVETQKTEPQVTTTDATSEFVAAQVAELKPIVSNMRRHLWPTLKYLGGTEVHTYAFSVAANAILSLFPAIILVLTLARHVFHSPKMFGVILEIVREYMPSNQEFIAENMGKAGRHELTLFPIVMLFVSCTGIFLPLEVALNKVWGIKHNRSYLMNQLVSLGLALACGVLVLGSIAGVTALAGNFVSSDHWFWKILARFIINIFAIPASIGVFFLIYWLLPNGKVPAKSVLPAAGVTGALFEIARHIYAFFVPILNFQESYGPFHVSVTLIFWAYVCGMLLLGGAFLSAADHVQANVEVK
jgi:membrane protein/epoxyqueuosine reductase